jgi:8-oxo-dGTP diphosphatase
MTKINRLNIRVYGLLINERNQVLLSHEKIGDFAFTKFPGGGLELGEGIKDCLIREFKEEVNIDVKVNTHFYTTDFFQQSAFKETDQLISIYYYVSALSTTEHIRLDAFEIENDGRMELQQFEWKLISELSERDVTFPIDKLVVKMLNKSSS